MPLAQLVIEDRFSTPSWVRYFRMDYFISEYEYQAEMVNVTNVTKLWWEGWVDNDFDWSADDCVFESLCSTSLN